MLSNDEAHVARAHLEKLAKQHDITVRWIKRRWRSEAHIGTKQVWIPMPLRPLDYLIGLHEFGHILSPLSRRMHWKADKSAEAEAAREAAAWVWAVENAVSSVAAQLSRRDWRLVGDALVSFLPEHVPPGPWAGQGS